MGDRELAHAAVAAGERLRVAVSTNGSFTRLSRCYSFSPHLTLRFGSILSLFPEPISCPRNLSQLSMCSGLSQCSAGAGSSAGIPLLQVLIWIASVLPTEPLPIHWPFPLLHCTWGYSSRCFSSCTAVSSPKYLRTFAKFGWRLETASRTRCSLGKTSPAPL